MTLKKYKMHMVVANELLTHKDEFVVVTNNEKILVFRYKTQEIMEKEKGEKEFHSQSKCCQQKPHT
ncbi:phosphopantothenate--cysteine ligase 1 [Quercus suber]|uniref:Phosphopantothenate--cysteine ligase 1 n=1 Tax=Quercus suber TaxID=58331 RepID=A0AAW0J6S4_QUESU